MAARGRVRTTLRASSTATEAMTSAATRSAHHHPKARLARRPTSANAPRDAPIPLKVPSPLRALLGSAVPTRSFAMARGVRTAAEAPAESIAARELSGAVPAARARTEATVSVVAVRSRATMTTIDARASARWAACGSARSRWNRQTRVADPMTSAMTARPRPNTARLPANNPAVIDQAPAPMPQATENLERRSALCTRAWCSPNVDSSSGTDRVSRTSSAWPVFESVRRVSPTGDHSPRSDPH